MKGAELMGVTHETFADILHRRTRRVQARRVERVLLVLRPLRDDNVWFKPRKGYRRSTYRDKFKCRGCGTDLENFTEACDICVDRRAKQATRKTDEGRMAERLRSQRRRKAEKERRSATM
jgi:hypothetical protein